MNNENILKIDWNRPGKDFLVGAGPGDPDLITVKGRDLIRQAEVIIYDYLVSPLLLEEARPDAELVFVGKRGGRHSISQGAINELLLTYAHQGKMVVRLKGGDPLVFGRGGEEMQILRAAGIGYEVVPGVSSVVAVPAYAGIPVTHRAFTTSFTVISGHEDPSRPASESRLHWQGLVQAGGTLIFLMGVARLQEISSKLIEAGMSVTMPAAVIQWGTVYQQKTVTGNLTDIATLAKQAKIEAPAVTVIGQVVSLRSELQWFDEVLEEVVANAS